MKTLTRKTFMIRKEDIEREWLLVDADGIPLGRLASFVATRLRGKHKPVFTPHLDTGDFVIVVNAGKAALTSKKSTDKIYYKHSGYIGGMKATPYGKLMAVKPEFVVREAVRRMLPKNRLGRSTLTKLKVYAGEDHPHAAQKPKKIEVIL